MKSQDTKAQDFESSNTELFKSIFVGMAVEANIATLQGENPSRVYEGINNSAVENTRFVMQALKKEREDGVKEGEIKGRVGRLTCERLKFLIDAYKMSNKKVRIDSDKFIEWFSRKVDKRIGKNKDSSITCPYCGEAGFDKMKLKNHLEYQCKEYINQKEA